jgi:hypothetical protein
MRAAWGSGVLAAPRCIRLFRGDSGLGLLVRTGPDCPGAMVTGIVPGKAAAVAGSLQVGDVIVSINGACVRQATHEEIVARLRNETELALVLLDDAARANIPAPAALAPATRAALTPAKK